MNTFLTKQKNRIYIFLKKPFFSDRRTLFYLWFTLPLIVWFCRLGATQHNNFMIFRYVFWNLLEQAPSLYDKFPFGHLPYHDQNLYGPFFSVLIAPFAMPPVLIGLFLWLVTLSLTLYWAICKLPLPNKNKIFILWFCAHELLTALFMTQFNIAIVTLIVASFIFVDKEKECWAALCIVVGTFTKLYGIVGLAFFVFSKHKLKFVIWLLCWSVIAFVAPMLLSSPDYVIQQYANWFQALSAKNSANMFDIMTNISALGIIRKVSHLSTYSDLWIIIGGLVLLSIPFLRVRQYAYLSFRLSMLASILMFVVLFSTGSESSTYIIAFVGVALWYVCVPWRRSKSDVALIIFAFVLTSMSPSDLFPAYLRNEFVLPYALKALPCLTIWLKLSYEAITHDYSTKQIKNFC